MRYLRSHARALFIGTLLMTAPLYAANLNVELGPRSLTFTGVTPGGTLIVFGVAREPLNTVPITPAVVVRAESLVDLDRDGIVRLDLPVPVPRQGMWAAVDLTSGTHAAFPTSGYEPHRIEVGDALLRHDNAGQLKKVDWPFGEIDILVARPGEGAWRFYASKGSALDENRGGNHSLRLDLETMIPIGNSPEGPHKFRKGDIVAIFDRGEMQYGILEVGR